MCACAPGPGPESSIAGTGERRDRGRLVATATPFGPECRQVVGRVQASSKPACGDRRGLAGSIVNPYERTLRYELGWKELSDRGIIRQPLRLSTPVEEIVPFADHPDVMVRAFVAAYPRLPRPLRLELAADDEPAVRYATAAAVSTFCREDTELVRMLGTDPDPLVAGRAVTFCVHTFWFRPREDDLALHRRLAALEEPPEVACAALRAEGTFGNQTAEQQLHDLDCVARAGVSLLVRDDCDEATAVRTVGLVKVALDHSWSIDGTGSAGSSLTDSERRILLSPIIDRRGSGWRFEQLTKDLLDHQVLNILANERGKGGGFGRLP